MMRTAVMETEAAMAMTWRWGEVEEGWGKRMEEMLAGKEVRAVGEGGGGVGFMEGKKGLLSGGVGEEDEAEEKGILGIGEGWGEEDGDGVGGSDSTGKKGWWRRWRWLVAVVKRRRKMKRVRVRAAIGKRKCLFTPSLKLQRH